MRRVLRGATRHGRFRTGRGVCVTPEKIRMLDRWLGYPVCAVLTQIERCRRLLLRRDPSHPPRRLVFVKLIEMGSTVLAAPAFAEAVSRVGRDNVFLLLFSRNRPIADIMDVLPASKIIEIDDTSLLRFMVTLVAAMRRLRREGVDTAVDLEGLTRASAVITWMTGARRRAGYYNYTAEGPYRGRLFTHELNYNFQRHVAASFVAMTRAAFAGNEEAPLLKESVPEGPWQLPRFVAGPGDGEALLAKMEKISAAGLSRPIAVLNPNCSDLLPLRRWPDERFIELGKRILHDDSRATVVISGAADERAGGERIAHAIDPDSRRCISLAGRTTFRELLVLLSLADVLVSNDSGPCHFAALTDVAIVSLFGPETPQLYGPLGNRVKALCSGLACSPCVNMLNHRFSPCRNNRCMQTLQVDTVYQALRDLLDQPSDRGDARE